MAPDNAPARLLDLETLVNEIEKREDLSPQRRKAQLMREVEISLPVELSAEENRKLARRFVADQFVSRGMIAVLSIHEPEPNRYGERNPHVHIDLTMRLLEEDGFGNKERGWNSWSKGKAGTGEFVKDCRAAWAGYCNEALEAAGHSARVDHRTLEEQGIERLPTVHLGPEASALDRRGERSRRGDRQEVRALDNSVMEHEAAQDSPLLGDGELPAHLLAENSRQAREPWKHPGRTAMPRQGRGPEDLDDLEERRQRDRARELDMGG